MKVEKNIIKEFLLKYNITNQTIIIACSCGVDSMVLCDLLLKLKEELSLRVVLCHVNHKKREQSEIEEAYSVDFAKVNGIDVEVRSLDYHIDDNFQSNARDFRYNFFKEIKQKYDAKAIFTAHHGSDNLETLIFKLSRGSKFESYSAIKEHTLIKGCDIYRPLLDFSKEDIYEYAKLNNIKYFEDQSNQTLDYQRNVLRHKVCNPLYEIDNNIISKVKRFSQMIEDVSLLINDNLNCFIKSDAITYTNNGFSIDIKKFNSLNNYIKEEVLFELLKEYNLKLSQVNEILKIMNSPKVNIKAIINEAPYLEIVKAYEIVEFRKEKSKTIEFKPIEINGEGDYICDIISVNVAKKELNSIPKFNQLCYNSLYFPLVLRKRQNGDKVFIGSGYKKVKDILIDKKIPLEKRDEIFVLVNNQNEIVWVLGVYKSPKTKDAQPNCVIEFN